MAYSASGGKNGGKNPAGTLKQGGAARKKGVAATSGDKSSGPATTSGRKGGAGEKEVSQVVHVASNGPSMHGQQRVGNSGAYSCDD